MPPWVLTALFAKTTSLSVACHDGGVTAYCCSRLPGMAKLLVVGAGVVGGGRAQILVSAPTVERITIINHNKELSLVEESSSSDIFVVNITKSSSYSQRRRRFAIEIPRVAIHHTDKCGRSRLPPPR